MARSGLFEDFVAGVRAEELLERGESVMAAVSGGPDSIAMLDILKRFSRGGRIRLSACHLNHQLRAAESDEDEQFVRRTCESMGVTLDTAARDVAALAREERLSIEAAARSARYEYFAQAAVRLRASAVATAHTLSDDAETILQRLIEGAGPEGLSGIPLRRTLGGDIRVVRPLLFATRARIEAYLAERRLAWRVDSTNLEPLYLRNRIRLEILPLLRRINPSIEEALSRAGESVAALYEFARPEIERLWREAASVEPAQGDASQPPTVVLDRGLLLGAHRAIAGEVVKNALLSSGVDPRELKSVHVAAVLRVCEGVNPSAELVMPGHVRVRREYENLFFGRGRVRGSAPAPSPAARAFERSLPIPGAVELPDGAGIIAAEIVARLDIERFGREKGPREEVVDARAARGGLKVRFPRPGDAFRPLGAPGEKTLKELFIDAKIPVARRASAPVVTDDEGVIWVAGVRIAERARVTARTKRFLRLEWRDV